jgi:hypothetical protein
MLLDCERFPLELREHAADWEQLVYSLLLENDNNANRVRTAIDALAKAAEPLRPLLDNGLPVDLSLLDLGGKWDLSEVVTMDLVKATGDLLFNANEGVEDGVEAMKDALQAYELLATRMPVL